MSQDAPYAGVRVLDLTTLVADARFASFADRARHHEALVRILSAKLLERGTDEWRALLLVNDVLAERIYSHAVWHTEDAVTASRRASRKRSSRDG